MTNIPIFLSSDNNYAPFVATTIASICDNTKSFCEFYILDGGITEENKEKICELKKQFDNFDIEFIKVDIEKYFYNLPERQYISKSMYSRFLIPELKAEINKAIYSDVDVVVWGDISKMFNEDLGEFALGAVWEEYLEKSTNIKRKEDLNLSKNHKYFSSGNLLIDCHKWRENKILEKLLKIPVLSESNTPDMDILNIYFDNNYKRLDKKYCYLNQDFYYYKDLSEIIIRHFNGPIKPWQIHPDANTNLLPNLKDFWKYAKMTPFYNELLLKCQDKFKQNELIRKLRITNMHSKIISRLNRNN